MKSYRMLLLVLILIVSLPTVLIGKLVKDKIANNQTFQQTTAAWESIADGNGRIVLFFNVDYNCYQTNLML